MTGESLIIFLLIGGVAGWLAGLVVRGGGFGLIGNIVVGILGAFFGSWLFPKLGISIGGGVVDTVLFSTAGAIVLLVIISLFQGRRIA